MVRQSTDAIKTLEEILGLLRITKDNVLNRSTEPATPETDKMSTEPVPVVYNKNVSTKNMIPDLGWFDGDRTKSKD